MRDVGSCIRHPRRNVVVARPAPVERLRSLRFDTDAVVHGTADSLFTAQVPLRSLDRNVSKKELDLFQLTSCGMTQFRAGSAEVMRRELRHADFPNVVLHHVLDHPFGHALTPMPACATGAAKHLAGRDTSRSGPHVYGAFTQSGTGTVLICPPFPMRSIIAQCASRCCKYAKSRSASSRRRSPHPSRTARIARSRLPLSVSDSGDRHSRRTSSAISQFPSLTPNCFTPLTRRIPDASSGLSRPASSASYASRRAAASLPLMVPGAR